MGIKGEIHTPGIKTDRLRLMDKNERRFGPTLEALRQAAKEVEQAAGKLFFDTPAAWPLNRTDREVLDGVRKTYEKTIDLIEHILIKPLSSPSVNRK